MQDQADILARCLDIIENSSSNQTQFTEEAMQVPNLERLLGLAQLLRTLPISSNPSDEAKARIWQRISQQLDSA